MQWESLNNECEGVEKKVMVWELCDNGREKTIGIEGRSSKLHVS